MKFYLTVVVVFGMLMASIAQAGPIVLVGVKVSPSQQIAVEKIDHSTWNTLLQKYVDSHGNVDYTGWKSSAADEKQLDAYLVHLSAANVTSNSNRAAQLAFWINAYNAVTVKGILREYPTSSIRNHTAKIYGYNIWKNLQLIVAGKQYSLERIEHDVLRKMGEPRIHFAIVCASIGCPKLRSEAYSAERLDEQLTVNARSFFADRTKFVVDLRTKTIRVSPILDWFGNDFGADHAAQLRTIAPYLPESAQSLAKSGSARMQFLDYDWNLNDQAKLRSAAKK